MYYLFSLYIFMYTYYQEISPGYNYVPMYFFTYDYVVNLNQNSLCFIKNKPLNFICPIKEQTVIFLFCHNLTVKNNECSWVEFHIGVGHGFESPRWLRATNGAKQDMPYIFFSGTMIIESSFCFFLHAIALFVYYSIC